MKINGTDFPNLNKGYKTIITLPFEIETLGDNTISIWDAGNLYDQYMCKGTLILTATEMDSLFAIYNNTDRGDTVTLTDCISTGFFPFSPAVADTSYEVYIDNIKNKGMVDDIGKLFRVNVELLWKFPTAGGASTISWNNPLAYCKEGSLTFANYSDIRFPGDGFSIEKGHDVSIQNYKGAEFYGVTFDNKDTEWNLSEFSLVLRTNISSNIIYNLINTYRGNSIPIEGKDNYYIFGKDKGDNTLFSVKTNTNTLELKHVNHDNFELDIEVVKV